MGETAFRPCTIEYSDIRAKANRLRIKGNVLKIDVTSRDTKRNWVGFCMEYKDKTPEDKAAYLIDLRDKVKEKGRVRLSADVRLDSFPLRGGGWSLFLVYEENGDLFGCKILRDKGNKRKLKDFLSDSCYERGDYIAFVYYTKYGTANIRYREKTRHDGGGRKVKEIIAMLLYKAGRKHYRGKNIYLIHEKRCSKAQDNGYYLFMHAMENNVGKKNGALICYVIDKSMPDYGKIRQYDSNVIEFMSIKHMIYLMACKVIISSESRNHAYLWQTRESLVAPYVDKKKHVFLQHGILALKRLGDQFLARNMKSQLVTVSSGREAAIVRDELGFAESCIADTGYARFDALEDASADYREILLMPTFRPWIFGVERDVFVKSDYFSRYMELISSPRLAEMLEKNDLTLNLYQHPSIAEHTDAFSCSCPRVRIVKNGEVPLDELMMRCKLLITDYSSIVWDVLYMGKPTIFYQYDRDKYNYSWGSYIDLEEELPGENAVNCDELLDLLETYIGRDFRMNEKYTPIRDVYYSHLDRDNCKRIWEAISSAF